MDPVTQSKLIENRRQFFGRSTTGIGSLALASLLNPGLLAATGNNDKSQNGLAGIPHFAPRAKRVIYLLQSGAPSQMELLDYKPSLKDRHGQELPETIRQGQRLTGMTSGQQSFPIVNPPFKFRQHGKSGTWISDLLPHTAKVVDDICVIKSMHTEAINHDPAITFFQSGHQQPGRPSIGSWFSYGLGSENADLPAFVVLLSKNTFYQAQPIYSRLWGSGFLPSNHQGVKFRSQGDPVLYLKDPTGTDRASRRQMLDSLAEMNQIRAAEIGDPEIQTRIKAYEMAYRMQMSVPELADVSDEPQSTFDLYGEDARIPGSHAANCLLARRLAERDVRFIQIFHRGWDHHSSLAKHIPVLCKETDQGTAALITDLKQRGMLDDTLVIWGGEFGRTVYSQGGIGNYGRDHHPRCFSVFFAGGGVQGGISYGKTDEFCYNIVENPVHVHDFHATILHAMGVDHERLTYRFQGRDYRLTDVHGKVVKDILI
jgi:hypothetical protein